MFLALEQEVSAFKVFQHQQQILKNPTSAVSVLIKMYELLKTIFTPDSV